MSIEALKEQARKHEQNEDWSSALQVYVEAINRQSDEDQPDLGLYNRAGDLSTRLGDAVGAIDHYERAVDLYLEAELPNNAIAILKKILRNLPERSEVFLRMGQIRARQGFLTDARNNFLAYAEQKQQAGDMDEAFRALEEFADVAPGDVEVRLALADQLHAHERTDEALVQLGRVYHQYSSRGETEAAQGVEQRIREIDGDHVIPELSDLGGGFETNVLGGEEEFAGAFDPDQGVEGSFDEIALDEPEEIAFAEAESFEDSDDIALVEPEAISFDAAEEITFDDAVLDDSPTPAVEADAEVEIAVEGTEDPDGIFEFETAEAAIAFDDDDEELGFGETAEALDFGAAAFTTEDVGDDTEDLSTAAAPIEGDAVVADQDDWDVGADIEDAFISFEDSDSQEAPNAASPEASDEASDGEPDEWDIEAPVDAPAELAVVSDAAVLDEWPEPESETWSEGSVIQNEAEVEANAEIEDFVEAEGFVEPEGLAEAAASDAFAELDVDDSLPLIGFATDEESFDDETIAGEVELETETEPATAVALEESLEHVEEVAELGWVDAEPEVEEAELDEALATSDDLWTAVPAADAHTENEEDEWIGLEAADEPENDDAVAVTAAPSLSDFEDFSITDLREYVQSHEPAGGAWERIGRLTLEEGDTDASQQAFEEAHLAYAQGSDYMSAMRCVRELLLGEPDQIQYHQRLVEYARQADDRTLQVSAYLELADCLVRTGAPAKARAVHMKVLDLDPTNRRAAAAIGGEEEVTKVEPDEPSESYVDLGSMVIERGEKTTRWTVEAEEPLGEADFDFQDMLAQFKAKVAENVDVDDVKAHYDLGTAYKEMGLVDEAITEFQAALRADGQNLATFEMLGQCFMDKGQPEVAVRSLTRATEMPFDVEDELLGIYYYLGRAHEELGNADDAVEYYEKIFALDINFEDVTERLRALR